MTAQIALGVRRRLAATTQHVQRHILLLLVESFQQLPIALTNIHRDTPVVVAGDFNDVLGSLGRRILVPAGFRGPRRAPRTFPAWAPLRALDSLFVRGACELRSLRRPRSKGARTASDHVPLVAELSVVPTD